jgi:hypothetical protein
MRTLPYLFLVVVAGLSLASFLTSETLAADIRSGPCAAQLRDVGI